MDHFEENRKNKERAFLLHQKVPVVDLHLDLPGELLFYHRAGERGILHRDYVPVWKRAGISLIGASVFVEDEYLPERGTENVLGQIEALHQEIEEIDGRVCLIRDRNDLEQAYRKEKIGILLYLEGLDFLEEKELLPRLYELGVRGASLTWSRKNKLACGCCRADENRSISGGITQYGWQILEEMQRLNMFLDISHLNDDGIREILRQAEEKKLSGKILATHSNARTIHWHDRNLTDAQIKDLAGLGGVVGLNACSLLSGSYEKKDHLEMLIRQIRHLMLCAGEKKVCLGLDLCDRYDRARTVCMTAGKRTENGEVQSGNDALSGHEELLLLTEKLFDAGFSERAIKGLLGENAFAFLRTVFKE